MKLAFLVDVQIPRIDEFSMKLEDVINSVDGRLIYRCSSRLPIRILCAENDKYPPTDTPLVPSLGREVKDAKGNERGTLDRTRDRCNGSPDRRWCLVFPANRCIGGIRGERHFGIGNYSRNGRPDLGRSRNPTRLRLCFPPPWEGRLNEPSAILPMDSGLPSFLGGIP